MALEQTPFMSVEEYFELEERHPDTRYEYFDGYVYMMSGGTANRATIAGNVHAIPKSLLRGSSCRAYNSHMKVRVSANRYFLPDVTITCDSRDRGTAKFIQSPRLVVEVLSPNTIQVAKHVIGVQVAMKQVRCCVNVEERVDW